MIIKRYLREYIKVKESRRGIMAVLSKSYNLAITLNKDNNLIMRKKTSENQKIELLKKKAEMVKRNIK